MWTAQIFLNMTGKCANQWKPLLSWYHCYFHHPNTLQPSAVTATIAFIIDVLPSQPQFILGTSWLPTVFITSRDYCWSLSRVKGERSISTIPHPNCCWPYRWEVATCCPFLLGKCRSSAFHSNKPSHPTAEPDFCLLHSDKLWWVTAVKANLKCGGNHLLFGALNCMNLISQQLHVATAIVTVNRKGFNNSDILITNEIIYYLASICEFMKLYNREGHQLVKFQL